MLSAFRGSSSSEAFISTNHFISASAPTISHSLCLQEKPSCHPLSQISEGSHPQGPSIFKRSYRRRLRCIKSHCLLTSSEASALLVLQAKRQILLNKRPRPRFKCFPNITSSYAFSSRPTRSEEHEDDTKTSLLSSSEATVSAPFREIPELRPTPRTQQVLSCQSASHASVAMAADRDASGRLPNFKRSCPLW